MNHYFSSVGLAWESCVGICTDGAPSMVGSIKGFVTLAKRANKDIISTHCFLHCEALVAKTLGLQLKGTLDEAVKMVNFSKANRSNLVYLESFVKKLGLNMST